MVLDTAFVLALGRQRDDHHAQARAWVAAADDDLVTSPLALAEMDYMLARLVGRHACEALWSDFETGAYAVRWWADALAETIAIARRHPHVGLTDASLVALAARLRTNRIATFDHRHFRALTTPDGEPFVVLPADAD